MNERKRRHAPPLDDEANAQAACMLTPNFREAYEAFKGKREPKFV
jgi:hypothetical protein